MSIINSSKDCEINCDYKEFGSVSENPLNSNDVVKKFEKYRLKIEQFQAEYEEAKLVIDRLKEEINLHRDMEKHNSLEILSLRSQVKVLEEKRKSFFVISEKQRSIHKNLQKHDESITEIKNVIQEVRENIQNKISTASKEIELINENRNFQSALRCKEETLELIKCALKEKEELIQEHVSRNNELNVELKNLKSEKDEIVDFHNKTVESYKNQIDEYEAKIQKMEQERKRILADYEVCTTLQTNYESISENFEDQKISNTPGSSMAPSLDERENISTAENVCHKNSQTQITRVNFSKDVDFKIKKNSSGGHLKKAPKFGSKQKPKIEFIDSCKPQKKRRLYSDNDNNYIG